MLKCKVVTPNKLFFDGEADSIIMPAADGEIGILEDHAPLITLLSKGRLIIGKNKDNEFQIEGGFAEVKSNSVMVFAEKVENVNE